MRVITRPALLRLGIAFAILAMLVLLGWWNMIRMPLQSYQGPWLPLSPEELAVEAELRRHVAKLAGEIGDRNLFVPARLRQAEDYLATVFADAGFQVRRYPFTVLGETVHNLEIELPGNQRANEIVVIGAHYDSVPGCPAANDNGSGVAALLVLARQLAGSQPERTLRLVAFTNEEPPFFQTANMGSLVYAQLCRERNDNIVAMLSLETIGCFSDEPRSQQYPFPVGMFYPSRGNFIAFVGNTSSRELVRECVRLFRSQAKFPSEGAALPGGITGVAWSDHWSFWQAGYPAIMITDTAPFRYPHYHSEHDTPEKLNYDRMARLVCELEKTIWSLANPGS